MLRYVIRSGEFLSQLAHQRGFDADEVWQHEQNRALRERRPNYDVLCPGDVVFLPAQPPPASVPINVGARNRYRARVPRVPVRLVLRDHDDRLLAGRSYRVSSAGFEHRGTTDGEGVAAFSSPVDRAELTLTIDGAGEELRLRVGHMDPVDAASGVTKRLQNLGFLARGAELALNRPTLERDAIAGFQRAHDLEATGEMNDGTSAALLRAHGS